MSSLLQHTGRIDRKKRVELILQLTRKGNNFRTVDVEPVELPYKGGIRIFPKLYRIWRKPKGMLGNWVIFRYSGEDHLPDLSVTIDVEKLPRDAEPLTEEEMIRYWNS